jgi:hypothetical protein
MTRLTPARRGGVHCPTERTRSNAHEERASLGYVDIDLYTKERQICLVTETGAVIEERKPHGTPNLLGIQPNEGITR